MIKNQEPEVIDPDILEALNIEIKLKKKQIRDKDLKIRELEVQLANLILFGQKSPTTEIPVHTEPQITEISE